MTDLLSSLPDFPSNLYSHLLPSLDRHFISVSDLLTLDASDIARRAQLPPGEVRKLANAIVQALHCSLGVVEEDGATDTQLREADGHDQWQSITTLSPELDAILGGVGIPTQHVVEIVGESGAAKTQLLLSLLLAVQLPKSAGGLAAPAIYLSTEASLSTPRLAQMLRANPRLISIPLRDQPSLQRILTLQIPDLESQDHILRYQLPVAIRRHGVRLVVIDSIAANYRAEFDRGSTDTKSGRSTSGTFQDSHARRAGAQAMAARRAQLIELGALLRAIAREHDVAIVVANQVADRFAPDVLQAPQPNLGEDVGRGTVASFGSSKTQLLSSIPSTQAAADPTIPRYSPPPPRIDTLALLPSPSAQPMTLDHQQRFFTGWGDTPVPFSHGEQLKTPSLGLAWSNQLSCRIALIRRPAPAYHHNGGDSGGDGRPRRYARVAFCAWAAPTVGRGLEFEVWEGGVRAVGGQEQLAGQEQLQGDCETTDERGREGEEEEEGRGDTAQANLKRKRAGEDIDGLEGR